MQSARMCSWALLSVVLAAGCSRSHTDYVKSGDDYYAHAKYKEAIVEYRNAVQKAPTSGEAPWPWYAAAP